jgi:hypothetical protein
MTEPQVEAARNCLGFEQPKHRAGRRRPLLPAAADRLGQDCFEPAEVGDLGAQVLQMGRSDETHLFTGAVYGLGQAEQRPYFLDREAQLPRPPHEGQALQRRRLLGAVAAAVVAPPGVGGPVAMAVTVVLIGNFAINQGDDQVHARAPKRGRPWRMGDSV